MEFRLEMGRLARMALAALLPCVAMSASAKVAGPVALGVSPFADTDKVCIVRIFDERRVDRVRLRQ